MDGVPQNLNTLNDPAKDCYKILPTSIKKRTSKNVDDNGVELARAVSSVAISDLAKQIIGQYEHLEKIDDPVERKAAMEGFKKAMGHVAGGALNMDREDFLARMDSLRKRDEASFRSALITVDALSTAGYDTDRWLSVYLLMEDPDRQSGFLAETKNILQRDGADPERVRESLNNLLKTSSRSNRV